MRRLMVTAVAAAMVLTSCSSVTKTRESAESNETGGYAAAYTEILGQYEDKIRLIEDSEDHSFEPCALYDITGDGIPELFIVYASDEEEAHPVASGTYEIAALSIYTYDEERDRAESMMHWPSFANFEESALIPGTDGKNRYGPKPERRRKDSSKSKSLDDSLTPKNNEASR